MMALHRWSDRTLVLAAVVLFTVLLRPAVSANDGSRLATVESLVERHTFIIDDASLPTPDKYRFQGHFYSDKPPLLALVAAIPYAALHAVGFSFKRNVTLPYAVLTLATSISAAALGLLFLRRTLRRFPIDPSWGDVVVLIAATGTLLLPYATVFSNHAVAAGLLMIGFHYLCRLDEGPRCAALAGLFTALAGSVDIAAFVFVPAFGVAVLRRPWPHVAAFAVQGAAVLAIYLRLNWTLSGSVVPPGMNKSLWDYEGSEFGEGTLTGLATHRNAGDLAWYAFHMLIGYRGLFSYTPILVFSMIGAVDAFRRSDFHHRLELGLALAGSAVYVATYILHSVGYGGYCYGARWYADLMLLLCVPLGFLGPRLDASPVFRRSFLAVSLASIVISFLGANKAFTRVDEVRPNPFVTCLLEPLQPQGQPQGVRVIPRHVLYLVRNVRYVFIWIVALGACWFFQRTLQGRSGSALLEGSLRSPPTLRPRDARPPPA